MVKLKSYSLRSQNYQYGRRFLGVVLFHMYSGQVVEGSILPKGILIVTFYKE